MDNYSNNDPASFVAGVPVKISEKFRPPPRINLPASCSHQVDIDLLTTEHDFTYEEMVIKYIEDKKVKKNKLAEERAERIQGYDFAKKEKIEQLRKEEEERLIKLREEEEIRIKKIKEIEEQRIQRLKAVEEQRLKRIKEQEEKFLKQSSADSSSQDDAALEERPVKDVSINIEDSSINDDETQLSNLQDTYTTEENKVKDEQPLPNGYKDGTQFHYPPTVNSAGNVLVPTQVYPMQEKQMHQQQNSINISEFETTASDPFDAVALKSINDMEELAQVLQATTLPQNIQNSALPQNTQNNAYKTSYSMYSNNAFISNQPSQIQNQNYSQANQLIANNRGYYSQYTANPHSVYQPYNYQQPTNSEYLKNTQTSHISNTTVPNSQVNSDYYRRNHQINHLYSANNSVIPKRPDLEDFYSKYYSPKPQAKSDENTPTFSKSLRSSSSVPDLTVEDAEVYSFNRKGKLLEEHSARPSSTGLLQFPEGASNKYQNLMKSKLPDPFLELTADAQSLVQSLSEMGFPRPRVARAVQKLGTDHKKLLEVLLALQNYQDSGESEYMSEVAFYYYMGDLEKVCSFLTSSKQLIDLGFSEARVIDALFKYNNDSTKALEELVS